MPEPEGPAGSRARAQPKQDARQRTPSTDRSQATSGPAPDLDASESPGDSLGWADYSRGTFERHAALLGDPRLALPANARVRVQLTRQLQRDYGNQYVQRLVEQLALSGTSDRGVQATDRFATTIQRDENGDDGPGFWERWEKAVMEQPQLMASQCQEFIDSITPVLADLPEGSAYFDSVYDGYWGFAKLKAELLQMEKNSKTTEEQRSRANALAEKWVSTKERMEAANLRRVKASLQEAANATEKLRVQLIYAYRDIYNAGEEPGDVKVGSSNIKDLAEKGVDLLKAINEADAQITGRGVTPVIPVLEKTLTVVNLITGWKVTSGLASESQQGMAALQNAWNLANAGLSLGGFGKFLPLFGHIGPLLDGIAKGWDRVVSKLREQNRTWWQLRDDLGEDVPYPQAFPGGRAVFDYMKAVFKASGPLPEKPADEVVEFFDDNREMFTKTAKEVMGKKYGGVPTESSWLFWEEVDPDRLNKWVFYNKEMAWRLIYGRGMDLPD